MAEPPAQRLTSATRSSPITHLPFITPGHVADDDDDDDVWFVDCADAEDPDLPDTPSFDDAEPADDIPPASRTDRRLGPSAGTPALDALQWTLVFVPDGFTEAEQDVYNGYVDDVLHQLMNSEPFASSEWYWRAISPVRINISSPVSGLRDSTLGPMNHAARTPFGMTLGRLGEQAFPYWDRTRHQRFLDIAVPPWDATVIIGNADIRGGLALGDTAGVNIGSEPGVVIHEIGHMMGLTDEYEACTSDKEPDRHWFFGSLRQAFVEPSAPNVAYSDYDIDTRHVPWSQHLGATWSSFRKEECDVVDGRVEYPNPSPLVPPRPLVDDELVGAFEGNLRGRCKSWRAQWNCMMRYDRDHDFCVACADGIRTFLLDHVREASQ